MGKYETSLNGNKNLHPKNRQYIYLNIVNSFTYNNFSQQCCSAIIDYIRL